MIGAGYEEEGDMQTERWREGKNQPGCKKLELERVGVCVYVCVSLRVWKTEPKRAKGKKIEKN